MRNGCCESLIRAGAAVLSVCLAMAWFSNPAPAGEVEGFTEPYRTIDVAAAEMGIVAEMLVREGDSVRKGQVLATLDQDIQRAQLATAEQAAGTQGPLASALAERELRKHRLEKLVALRANGNAQQEEVERARADLAIAEANVRTAEEDLTIKRLDLERIKVQLRRREVHAPSDGVVTKLHKDPGESVTPNDTQVCTLVQLDPLAAVFSMSGQQAQQLKAGQPIDLLVGESPARGTVEFVSPVTNAESGTVQVRVRIDNPQGRLRSGERCMLRIAGSDDNASAGRDAPGLKNDRTITSGYPHRPRAGG